MPFSVSFFSQKDFPASSFVLRLWWSNVGFVWGRLRNPFSLGLFSIFALGMSRGWLWEKLMWERDLRQYFIASCLSLLAQSLRGMHLLLCNHSGINQPCCYERGAKKINFAVPTWNMVDRSSSRLPRKLCSFFSSSLPSCFDMAVRKYNKSIELRGLREPGDVRTTASFELSFFFILSELY